MDELKPCPFCGHKAGINDWTCGYESGTTVQCTECGASVNDGVENGDGWHDRAIVAWNRRTAPENVRNLLETIHTLRHENANLVTKIERMRNAAPEDKALTVTLPCNIGDIVYEVEDGLPIIAYHVTGFVLGKTEFEDEDDIEERQGWQVEYGKPGIDCESSVSEFGKSLFLTREAAEQSLNASKPEGSEKP